MGIPIYLTSYFSFAAFKIFFLFLTFENYNMS